MSTEDELVRTVARDEIRQCLARYCRGVDRKDWALLRSTYHEDAHDDHGAYKGDVEGLIEWIARGHERVVQSMHFLGGSVIEVRGEAAAADTQCVTFQIREVPPDDAPAGQAVATDAQQMVAVSRYADRFERRGGTWRIAHRVCILETLTTTTIPLPVPPADQVMASRSMADASYRVFSELLTVM
jgi:hypothetical protein